MPDLKSLKENELIQLLEEMRNQQQRWKAEAEAHLAAVNAEKERLAADNAVMRAERDDAESVHSQRSHLSAFPTTNMRSTTPIINVSTSPTSISVPLPSPWLTNVSKTKDVEDVKKLPWLESLSLAHLEENLFHCVGVKDIDRLEMISRIRYPVLRKLAVTLAKAVHNNTVLYAFGRNKRLC